MNARLIVLALSAALALPAGAARAEGTLVRFDCGGAPNTIESMENEYVLTAKYGGCWFHLGHHTYDAGRVFEVGAVSGSLFSVEVELSPPTDLTTTSEGWPAGAIAFEASLDGLAWVTLATIPWRLDLVDRKAISFSFDGQGTDARFFRIRQPRSSAHGLSGYLDGSSFVAELFETDAIDVPFAVSVPPIEVVPGTRLFDCSFHVMERFFETHPCTFGGVNRWDSPSVFHTYPISESIVNRIAGSAVFGPWRADDYHFDGGGRTAIAGWVQTSADGVNWTNAATISGIYGTPIAFDVELAGADVSFVRIVAELMKAPKRDPSLKHVRGFLLHSRLEVTGPPAY